MAHQVFISHGSPDKTIADAACARLEARGIRCWIAPRDVRPGMPYAEELALALDGAKVLVLIFSSHANFSKHVAREVEQAVRQGMPVIPLRVENVEPSKTLGYFISSVHWLDALTPPLEQHLEQLAHSVQRLLDGNDALVAKPGAGIIPGTAGAARAPRRRAVMVAAMVAVAAIGAIAIGYMRRSASADVASIVGCWQLPNGVRLNLQPNRQVTGAPLVGQWTLLANDRYTVTWPTFVDQLVLSDNGRTLSGVNNYGLPQQATRVGDSERAPRSLAGSWRYNRLPAVATPDGAISAGLFQGRWRSSGESTFVVEWTHRVVDNVSLLTGGNELKGVSNFGVQTTAVRTACEG